jgi:O-antigen/teichoic acid export membrane protein
MSLARHAATQGTWLAIYRFFTQAITWTITIYVARLLGPEEYGLMAMAAFFTAYAETFSELGLGSAIVQRTGYTSRELSSLFWLCVLVGLGFSAFTLVIAYPTAHVFSDTRLVPVTQLISLLFFFGALSIVPNSLLVRRYEFRLLGRIALIGGLIASLAQLAMALAGWGVYALLGGAIALRFCKLALLWHYAQWTPQRYFSIADVRPYLRFGLHVATAGSISTAASSLDKLIPGRLLGATYLGYYSYSQALISAPMDKVLSVLHQVFFPVLSRLDSDKTSLGALYLRLVDYIAKLLAPIYVGTFVFANEIVAVFLGPTWMPIVPLLRFLCVGYLTLSLTTINAVVHTALGRPGWTLAYTLASSGAFLVGVYVAASAGFSHLGLPWVIVHPCLGLVWTMVTLRSLSIAAREYVSCLGRSLLPAGAMLAGLFMLWHARGWLAYPPPSAAVELWQGATVGASLYIGVIFLFERRTRSDLVQLWRDCRR